MQHSLQSCCGDGEQVQVVKFRLPFPPHGVNHATQVAQRKGRVYVYKRSESAMYEHAVHLMMHGWVPPLHTPLAITLVLGVPRVRFRRLDLDKWTATVIDAVLGARYDQWLDSLQACKQVLGDGDAAALEGWVDVTVTWRDPRALRPDTTTTPMLL